MDEKLLNYGQAIEAMQNRKMVARKSWNGNMFVFKQIPAEIGLEIIPKMQSVPECVKSIVLERKVTLKYTHQMAVIYGDGGVDSWVASSSDTFADDWVVLD